MTETHCPHCGAKRSDQLSCSVCELPYDKHTQAPAASFVGRLWQSGRLAALLAAALFLLAFLLPIATIRRLPDGPLVSVSPMHMALQSGPYAREIKAMTMLALPLSIAALVQFLLTRTTGRAMRATRPLLLMVSLLPLLAMGLGVARFERGGRFLYSLGPALWVTIVAVVFGLIAMVRFGTGVAEAKPRHTATEDDDES
jgi:hypothetical protein